MVTPYPGAWLVNPISGTLLRASRDQKSWIDARTACQNDGGDLVKIPDLAMNDFVSALIRMNGGGRHWIGLHDVQTENKFVWLDEDEMAQFTYWAKGQPNNYIHNKLKSEGQDCVEIGTFAPKWQDDVCSTKSKYVCEKQDGVSLNPTHGQPTVWFASPQSDTEVKIFSDLKSWSDARQACQAEGGDLVKILQSNMNKFLADIIRVRGGGRHWIGLNDLAQENRFVWLDEDKQANYTNWAAGQPNNYRINKTTESGGQHCVEIGTFAPRWQDDMCSRLSKFICGRPVTKSATINRTAGSFKCPDNWSASPLSGTCVKVYEGKKTWPGARAVCKAYGGDLVKIRDQDMNSFLAGLLTKDSTKQYWIGLRDTQGDKFQWLDETEKASYTNWASKEHSKTMMEESKRLQNCAVIGNLIPKWQSVSCSQSAGFICEIAVRSFASAHTGQGHTDHSSLIVGIVLCVCLVAAGLAAFVVYKRRHSRKSLMSGDATVSFTNLVDESIFDESPSGL